ncbi:hypothetical protein TNCV_2395581 [Trichonephila clavipes]|nr:hypothetical protein TNCV_2395581 [Trichonephila clavipes]
MVIHYDSILDDSSDVVGLKVDILSTTATHNSNPSFDSNILGHKAPKLNNLINCSSSAYCAVALSTIQVTVRFGLFPAQFLGRIPGDGHGPPPLFLFHQPHERTCGSMAPKSTPMPRRHYTFTNIHVFSRIREPRLYGTAVSVANHYTGWANGKVLKLFDEIWLQCLFYVHVIKF